MKPETRRAFAKARREATDFAVFFFLFIAAADRFFGSEKSVQEIAFQSSLTALLFGLFKFWHYKLRDKADPRLRDR